MWGPSSRLLIFSLLSQGIIADPTHHHLAQLPHHEHTPSTSTSNSTHWLESFRLLASELSIDIVPGTIVEKDQKTGDLHNVAYYIDKRGEVKGRYTKRNLWHPEKVGTIAEDDDET